MKKRRKGNLLQRMMAVLLSAVLIAGTAYGAVPLNVLAQESDNGNTAEITETETATDLDMEEPAEITDEEEPGEESAEEETKPADSTENLSGEQNDDLDKAPEDPNAGEEGSEPAGGNGDEGAEPDAVTAPKKKCRRRKSRRRQRSPARTGRWMLTGSLQSARMRV